jgi:hypothetical protein
MNKLLITSMSLSLVVLFTSNNNFTNANAALTAPSSYDLAYVFVDNPSPAPDYFALIAPLYELNGFDIPYTRTSDGSYFNYTTTLDNDLSDRIPLGLEITQTFNRSNTSWSGTTGGFVPTSSTIGSDTSVGTIQGKHIFTFNNQTSNEYKLYLDVSSSSSSTINFAYIQTINVNNYGYYDSFFYIVDDAFGSLFLPSYTSLTLTLLSTSATRYFDAWYLKDLGISEAYGQGENDGYDMGYNQGYGDGEEFGYEQGYETGFEDGFNELNNTASGLFQILGSAFTSVGSIFNIMILPGITIGMLVFVPIIFALLLFIIKILRGGS